MGMSRKAGPTRREVTAGSAGVAGEAGPVCSPGCDESNASGWPSPPGRGGRSHEGHSSGDPTLNAGTLETLGGEGAWSGVPRRCEWEQGQTLLSPPGARNSPYGRPACVPTSQEALGGRPGAATENTDWVLEGRLPRHRTGGAPGGRAGGGLGAPAVSSRRFVGAGSAPRPLLLASHAGGLGRTTMWNMHGFSEWEGLTAF